jgi:hypothetical protein
MDNLHAADNGMRSCGTAVPTTDDDDWSAAAIRSYDTNHRKYYEGRNGRFWLAEYRRAGCA